MDKKKVLSVHYDGKVYSIYECVEERLSKGVAYRTFIGRRRLDSFAWLTFAGALGSILSEIRGFDMDEYRSILS